MSGFPNLCLSGSCVISGWLFVKSMCHDVGGCLCGKCSDVGNVCLTVYI